MRRPALIPLLSIALTLAITLACNDGTVLQPESSTLPAPALTSNGADHGPVVARATGSGHYLSGADQELRSFSFSAIRHADGYTTGEYQLNNRGRDVVVHGRVLCLSVVDQNAWLGVVVDKVTADGPTSIAVGQERGVLVIDDGEGAADPPDLVSGLRALGGATAAEVCQDKPGWGTSAVQRGNVQVWVAEGAVDLDPPMIMLTSWPNDAATNAATFVFTVAGSITDASVIATADLYILDSVDGLCGNGNDALLSVAAGEIDRNSISVANGTGTIAFSEDFTLYNAGTAVTYCLDLIVIDASPATNGSGAHFAWTIDWS